MRRLVVAVSLAAGVAMAAMPPTLAQRPAEARTEQFDGREVVRGEVLLKLRGQPVSADLTDLAKLADADGLRPLGRTGIRRLRSRSRDVRALLRLLSNHPAVVYAEPNHIVRALATPPDPLVPQLWGLQNVGQAVNGGVPGTAGADIKATAAWDVSTGSTAHVVAVVDTGIDYTHPDLADNMWSAPSAFTVTIGGVPLTCPAGSHGFNAIALTCDPMDDHNHGTHVAGTIGASAANGIGVVGINWTTRLMGVKFIASSGSGTIADAINALDFVRQAREAFAATGGADVRVLSNSWGSRTFSQALRDEIAATADDDMLFVAAAGNDGFSNDILPLYPASYDVPSIISVAATTNTDTRAFFSNYGAASVDLGAPGVDILSTVIGGGYGFASGTSMATPHVSGAAALVLSRCGLDTTELRSTLLSTVHPVAALGPWTVTGGRLDVDSAIRSCMAPPATPAGLVAQAGDARVVLSWSPVSGATSFSVKRAQVSGGPYAVVGAVSTTAFTDTNVSNNQTYFYVVSSANSQGVSADSSEVSATPKAPADLVISALTAPAIGGAGSSLAVSVTTRNQGAGAAVATTTRLYLSTNTLLDAADVLLNAAQSVPALAPGASANDNLAVVVPAATTTGFHYVIAKADADAAELEPNESNNTQFRMVSIGPDLAISALTAPPSAAAGATIPVSETVRNQGGGTAAQSTTRFYLSVNAVLDAADPQLSGGRSVPALAKDGVSAGSTMVTLPAGLAAGTYYLFAKADGDLVVPETQESNNTTIRSLQIGGDLAVTAMTVPAKAGAGTSISISDTTANTGAGAIGASTTRFYLSANSLLDAADVVLSGARVVPALAPATSTAGTTVVSIPANTATGAYFVIAKADADGAVAETVESNNVTARALSVGPDLAISAFSVPFAIAAGSTVSVSDTVVNQGGGPAAASATRYFLSTNFTLDAADTLLTASRAIPALAPNASSAGVTAVPIPAGLAPGTYYLFVKADGDTAVTESQEGNNTNWRAVLVSGS